MRATQNLTLSLLLCCVLALSGCPAPPADDSGSTPPAGSASSEPADSDTGVSASSADAPAGNDAEPPADPNAPPPRKYRLELDGLWLAYSYDEAHPKMQDPTSFILRGVWADEQGGTGVVKALPVKGGSLPAKDYCFAEGRLVGYFHRQTISLDDYLVMARELAVLLDPGTDSVPQWAKDDPLVRGLPTLEGASQRVFWADEGRHELLIIQRDADSGHCFTGLYNTVVCAEMGLEYSDLAEAFGAE